MNRLVTSSAFKQDFPLLVEHPEIVYLDSAATAQRPLCVLEALSDFYTNKNANALRGLYALSSRATQAIEYARTTIANHLGAQSSHEIVFTKNASESLNLIADLLGQTKLLPGDEVCISIMEHHSNMLPWKKACEAKGARLVWLYPNEDGQISEEELSLKITAKTKIVSITHVSNVLGTKTNVEAVIEHAHKHNALVVLDCAQSIPHMPINIQELDCDALVFSAHKAFGPFGVGVLWAKKELLDSLPPFLVGGEMVESVTQERTLYAEVPHKFEAGTQNAADIYASAKAIEYLQRAFANGAWEHEQQLVSYAFEEISKLDFVRIIGSKNPQNHHGVISFTVDGVHPHDVAGILDASNVCIRAGWHCAEPLLRWMNIDSCCRASFALYNTPDDVEKLTAGLHFVRKVFYGAK